AARAQELEDERRSHRGEIARLTQEATAKVERSELEAVQRRAESLEKEVRQAQQELATGTSRAPEIARELNAARNELGQAANLREQLSAAVAEGEHLRTQARPPSERAARAQELEDELRLLREAIARLTQEATTKVERNELETVQRLADSLE